MTSAIEQTRREMYAKLANLKFIPMDMCGITRRVNFEEALEAHLEELREAMKTMALGSDESLKMIKTLAEKGNSLIEERDTLRNKLQALQMASSTAAEVIRGLRSELEEAREDKFIDDVNPYGAERQIASCRAAVDRWQAISGTSDRQALLEIVAVLREIPE